MKYTTLACNTYCLCFLSPVHHKRGNTLHFQDQPKCSKIQTNQYRLFKTRDGKYIEKEVQNAGYKSLKTTLFMFSGFVQICELSCEFQKNVCENVISPVGNWRKLQSFQRYNYLILINGIFGDKKEVFIC